MTDVEYKPNVQIEKVIKCQLCGKPTKLTFCGQSNNSVNEMIKVFLCCWFCKKCEKKYGGHDKCNKRVEQKRMQRYVD